MSDKILLTIISFFVLLFATLIVILFSAVEQEDSPQPTEMDLTEQPGSAPEIPNPAQNPEANGDYGIESPPSVGSESIEPIKPSTPWGALAGRVVDERDTPIPDALVFLYRSVPARPFKKRIFTEQATLTDKKGAYILSSVPTDSTYALFVKARGFAAADMDGLRVAPNRTVQVTDFRLNRGRILKGTVTDTFGSPLEGVKVKVKDKMKELVGMTEEEAHPAIMWTGAQGGYEITNLSQSQYELTFSLEGYRSVTVTENFTPFSQGENERVTDVQLEPGGLAIRGKVVDLAERPVADAKVQALFSSAKKNAHFSQDTTSDSKGRFDLIGLSEGEYSLWVRAKGHFQKDPIHTKAGSEDVVVTLSPTGAVEGAVRAPGKLPKRYTVSIDSYTPTIRTMGQNRKDVIKCGPKAAFRIDDLFPGKYVFLVKAAGYAHTKSGEVEVLAGETASGIVVDLLMGGSLKGRVTDSKGNPVSKASVGLMDEHYEPSLPFEEFFMIKPEQDKTASTDGKGAFLLDHIRAGHYTLKIETENMAKKIVRQINVAEGETTDLGAIQLFRGGTIKGSAYDEKGYLSKGAKITAVSMQAGNRKTVTTDNKGRFVIKNLAPGEYKVSLTLKDFWAALKYETSVDAYVYENETTQIDIFTRPAERTKK